MADDLDTLLRATMKTLDDQVPSGYFDALPDQTLARLESSMQQGTSGPTKQEQSTGVPPPVVARSADDDSGLHDIRNLAQSTKQRLSSKRITTNPPASDADVLANSSASWKNLALPQPAKMVSLPALDELPSKQEVLAKEKQARTKAADATAAPGAASAAAIEARQPFARPAAKRSKGPILAVAGMVVAAAAGAIIFMQSGAKTAPATTTTTATTTTIATIAPAPAPTPQPPPPAPVQIADSGSAAALPEPPKVDVPAPPPVAAHPIAKSTSKNKRGNGKVSDVKPVAHDVVETKPPDAKPDKPAAKGAGGEAEPSFDELLKEAGVEKKQAAKPKLDKKSLSGDDFKTGMASVASKAQGCYKGTQGTASIKVAISPSGQVTRVSVTGQFANTPVAACVVGAVKGASFPPWDGGPQSFNYSYLLSE